MAVQALHQIKAEGSSQCCCNQVTYLHSNPSGLQQSSQDVCFSPSQSMILSDDAVTLHTLNSLVLECRTAAGSQANKKSKTGAAAFGSFREWCHNFDLTKPTPIQELTSSELVSHQSICCVRPFLSVYHKYKALH